MQSCRMLSMLCYVVFSLGAHCKFFQHQSSSGYVRAGLCRVFGCADVNPSHSKSEPNEKAKLSNSSKLLSHLRMFRPEWHHRIITAESGIHDLVHCPRKRSRKQIKAYYDCLFCVCVCMCARVCVCACVRVCVCLFAQVHPRSFVSKGHGDHSRCVSILLPCQRPLSGVTSLTFVLLLQGR